MLIINRLNGIDSCKSLIFLSNTPYVYVISDHYREREIEQKC